MVGSVDVDLSGQDHSGDSYREGLQEAENTHTTCFFVFEWRLSLQTKPLNYSFEFKLAICSL